MKKNWLTIAFILLAIYFFTKAISRSEFWQYTKTLRLSVRNKFENFLSDIKKLGYRPVVISSHRSFDQQAYYKKLDKRNASPGHSTHELDTGLDIVLYSPSGQRITKNSPRSVWMATGVPSLAKNKYGMRWGGDFPGYADNVHFEYLLS